MVQEKETPAGFTAGRGPKTFLEGLLCALELTP
jgi:hypothetical protein